MPEDLPFEIDVEALAAWRAEGPAHRVLDVREGWEREICALSGSLHIPMNELPARVDELARDETLVVLCHHGMRSARVTQWLRAQGFERATNLAGGIDAWAKLVDTGMDVY